MTSANNNGLHDASVKAQTALLLIDVINDLNFDGGENLLTHALPMAINLSMLKRRAKAAGIPAIYVNDNFGRWRSDFKKPRPSLFRAWGARPFCRYLPDAGGKRLFCAQTETLSFFPDQPRNLVKSFGNNHANICRHGNRYLCAL
jgi:nicotinamidase-related amidase